MKQTSFLKMNKILSILSVLNIIFLFTGCVQKLPKPSENINAILVIPAKVSNKTQMERKYDYVFNFQRKPSTGSWDDGDSYSETELFSKGLTLKQNGESLTIVFDLPAGEHRLYSITENPINVINDNPETKRIRHRPFTLGNGKIYIYPYKFDYSQELLGTTRMFRSSRKLKNLKKNELYSVSNQLKQFENFESWTLQNIVAESKNVLNVEGKKPAESLYKSTQHLELDVGINSKYQLTSERSWLGLHGSGEAELEGNDIRFVYGSGNNVSWGIRISSHSGKEYTSSAYYSITTNEFTPYVRYDHALVENETFLLEGQIAAGFNLISTEIDHPSLDKETVSTLGFMLEPGIFTGMKVQNKMLLGAGLKVPLDSYEGSTNWLYQGYSLNYNYTIKKSPVIYIIIRFSI